MVIEIFSVLKPYLIGLKQLFGSAMYLVTCSANLVIAFYALYRIFFSKLPRYQWLFGSAAIFLASCLHFFMWKSSGCFDCGRPYWGSLQAGYDFFLAVFFATAIFSSLMLVPERARKYVGIFIFIALAAINFFSVFLLYARFKA